MAFIDLINRLVGEVPGLPQPLAKVLINEALVDIYREIMWSFQLKESNWLTPGLLFASNNQSAGSITTTAYSNQLIGNSVAAAAWDAYINAATLPALTQLQIRVPYYSLYNIVGFSTTTNANDTITLDRAWLEPPGTASPYMIYQAYFAAPGSDPQDFRRFFTIRDTTNAAPLDFWTYSRKDLDVVDPQRTNFNLPSYVVPYEVDARVGSLTLGFMLYELWPHPLSILPYTFSYLRRGPLLAASSDTVPIPLTDELLAWRSKVAAYLWKEAQKGDGQQRGSGADWQFLSQAAQAKYMLTLKPVKDQDRDMFELYMTRFVRNVAVGQLGTPFATAVGGLNIGRF